MRNALVVATLVGRVAPPHHRTTTAATAATREAGVGAAIKDCWKGAREDLFVMTKIPGGLNASETAAAHRDNMARARARGAGSMTSSGGYSVQRRCPPRHPFFFLMG